MQVWILTPPRVWACPGYSDPLVHLRMWKSVEKISEYPLRNVNLEQEPVFSSDGDQQALWFQGIGDVQENNLFFPLQWASRERKTNIKNFLKDSIKRQEHNSCVRDVIPFYSTAPIKDEALLLHTEQRRCCL